MRAGPHEPTAWESNGCVAYLGKEVRFVGCYLSPSINGSQAPVEYVSLAVMAINKSSQVMTYRLVYLVIVDP
jgi:hypothetical protein